MNDLVDGINEKYERTCFDVNLESELAVDEWSGLVQLMYFNGSLFFPIIDFKHIETIEQFEQLYLSLTGKELIK